MSTAQCMSDNALLKLPGAERTRPWQSVPGAERTLGRAYSNYLSFRGVNIAS